MIKKTITKRWCIGVATFLMSWMLAFSGYCQFVTTWKTDNTGTSNDDQITIPGNGTYTVAWEEVGNATNNGTANATNTATITFASAGTYKISITGTFTQIKFNNTGDRLKLLTIEKWGTTAWTSMDQAFAGCANLTYNATDAPDLTSVTSLAGTFKGCSKFNGNISNWNTNNVTNMSAMFESAIVFNQDISGWDIKSVTNLGSMFSGAFAFNQDISSWDTKNVTSLGSMFQQAIRFNQPIGSWNVSKVTNMNGLFRDASNFNQPIGNWNTSQVTHMNDMFRGAATFNQPIGQWDVSKVTGMVSMFQVATAFNQDISGWNTSNVRSMSFMFQKASAFNQDIGGWNTVNVAEMTFMFREASAFNQDIGGWNTSNVRGMAYMFYRASVFNQNISGWNTSNVMTMSFMFQEASAFNQPIGQWDISKVTIMTNMFNDATSFNQPLDNWNTSKVRSMVSMFNGATAFNQNLGNWDVTSVTNMSNMLNDSGLSQSNYDQTLTGWASQNVKSNVALGATGLKYCNSEASRNTLINSKNWTITGDTKECPAIDIEIQLEGNEIASNGTADFGMGASIIKTFTIKNIGTTTALTLSGTPIVKVTAGTAFVVTEQPGATSVAAGASLTFKVTYAGATNNDTGTLSIASNDPDEGTYIIQLKGVFKKTDQTITFSLGNDATKTFGDANFDLTATGGASGNAVTFASSDTNVATISGKTVTIVGAGSTTITASQAGNGNYNAATNVTQTLTINKANQTITFDLGNNATKTLGDAAFDLTTTGGASGNPITFTSSNTGVATISGNTVTIVGVGTTTITASQAGNNNYNAAADITQTLTVQSTVTAIPQELKAGKISVYPNPASHMLKIKITGKISYNYAEITVLNQQGKKVLLMGQKINNGQVEIPVDQLTSGEYLLHITIAGETIVRRIVKL
ncbi:hypothetical protein BKI52_08540 [marine bacterium AO1-C]|nr:hypothetical protein BKI52_08540 [marine bacterium AO1-C]